MKMKLPGKFLFLDRASPLSLYFGCSSRYIRFVSLTCGLNNCRSFHQHSANRVKTNHLIEITRRGRPSLNSFAGALSVHRVWKSAICPVSGARGYSTGDDRNDKQDDSAPQPELKGVVVHVPNPLLWMKNKWYTYLIRFSVDPAFNLEDFLSGAKQALSFLTRLIVQKDFDTLKSVASAEAVETVRQLVSPWTLEQQHSIEVLVEDITLATASIAALNKQKGDSYNVSVDVLCIAVKRFKSRPLLIQMTVRFQREYGKKTASDWFISGINEFVVREMTIAKGSDQQPK